MFGILVGLSVLLYINTINHKYTLDDAIVITENMFTQEGIKGIPGILSHDTFYGFFKEEKNLVSGGRYRPLTQVQFAIEKQIFGDHPRWMHLFNILWYAALSLVVFQFLKHLLRPRFTKYHIVLAFAAALLFITHPIHTEAVANIKGRDEIMALLLSLASLIVIMKEHSTWKNLLSSGVLFFLACMSKENAFTFLPIGVLSFYFFSKLKIKDFLIRMIPMFIAGILFIIIRTAVIGFEFGGEPPSEMMNNPFIKVVDGKYLFYTGAEKMASIFYCLLKYIGLLLFPHPLTHDYYPAQISVRSLSNWQVILSFVIYGAMLVWAVLGIRKKDVGAYCILFFLGGISLVANILFPVGTNLSERFLFGPSLAFCLAIAFYGKQLLPKRNVFFGVIAVICLLYSFKTITRNIVWKDNLRLFTTDVRVSNNSAKALNAAGGDLGTKAILPEFATKKNEMLLQSVTYLNKAIAIHPNYKNAHLLKGNSHFYLEDYDQAITSYQNALNFDPSYEEASTNIGIAYREGGKYHGQVKGDLNTSIQYLEKAKTYLSQDFETIRLLGVAYGQSGNTNQAIAYFEQALEMQPNDLNLLDNLKTAYSIIGNEEKAQYFLAKAKEIDPNAGN